MKRSIKLVVCMLLVATIALPSVFATGLGESSKIVKVGTVDNTDVNYDVDIEWGDMIFNLEKVEGEYGTYYEFVPNNQDSAKVTITNKSTAAVNADIIFMSNMEGITGKMGDLSLHGETIYRLLFEKPEDWETGVYYQKVEGLNDLECVYPDTEFEEGKYYEFEVATGSTPFKSQIDGVMDIMDGIVIHHATWILELSGGDVSNVRPGATIGTVTVTLS